MGDRGWMKEAAAERRYLTALDIQSTAELASEAICHESHPQPPV